MATSKSKQIASSAHRISVAMERNAKNKPMSEIFNRLQHNPDAIRLLLVGQTRNETQQALEEILNGIVSKDESRKLTPIGTRVLEVRLGEEFALISPQEEVFNDPSALVKAVDSFLTDSKRFREIGTGQLQISVLIQPATTPPINLLIAPPISDINNAPMMISSLAENCDWMIYVAKTDKLSDLDKSTLATLSLNCLCSHTVKKNTQKSGLPNAFTSPLQAPPIAMPNLKAEIDNILSLEGRRRFILGDWRNIKDIEDSLFVLSACIEDEVNKLSTNRLLQDEGLSSSIETMNNQNLRDFQDRQRTWLQDRFDESMNSLQRNHALELQPGGAAYKEIKQLADELEIISLSQVASGDRIVLSLTSDKQDMFAYALKSHIDRIIRNDISNLKTDMNMVSSHISQLLKGEFEQPPKLRFNAPNQANVSSRIIELANPEVRYSSEMAKMTAGRRFAEARTWLFPIMMAAMLIGALATIMGEEASDLRNMIYVGMIPVLIIAFAWTYISQKPKEEALITRELRRVRNEVLRDIRNMMTELLRKEEQIIKKEMDKSLRDAIGELGRSVREEDQRRQKVIANSKSIKAKGAQTIEQSLKEHAQYAKEVSHLQSQLENARKSIIENYQKEIT